jgi:hypothetical protein
MTVAVLGTGQMGAALARALASAGRPVVLGSRDPARARARVAELASDVPPDSLSAGDHAAAVRSSRVVILAVGYEHAWHLLCGLRPLLGGKIVVDPTTPWGDEIPPTSGADQLAKVLPSGVPLVAAWKTTFAAELSSVAPGSAHDALLCGDDGPSKEIVAELIRATGFRALDCGGLEHARTLEGMTRLMGPIARNLGLPQETVPAFRFAS